MGSSPNMVYAHFGGTLKLNVYHYTPVLCWIVRNITQYIRNKLETTSITNLGDYWNPPSSKVESLANISQQIESIEKERGKKVR